ncbi:hypothetical protein EXIGLDRAFT_773547 [Exidia glandulosa HHB12029]|uniref:Uncharacterized protein n=1 Tax=Exidia glandulosa HHB12029 TaxID=1314781 RepID=A0A165ES50_EXIGL|nr:hypothetical protein EXIGLDRAFT_773547 [Exidia glandulosa HHB12029]
MAGDSTPAPPGTGTDEDVTMKDAPKVLSLMDALRRTSTRSWVGTDFGIIGHSDGCADCATFGQHVAAAIQNGELASMLKTSRQMASRVADRSLLPVMSIREWAQTALPEPAADLIFPVCPMSLIMYYLNVVPAMVDFIERSHRSIMCAPGTTEADVAASEALVAKLITLLKELVSARANVGQLTLAGGYTRLSDDTPPAILALIPRPIRGDRSPIYPTVRLISTPHGDVACAVPNRALSLLELDDNVLVVPRSAGGHAHWPGSNWLYVRYRALSKKELVEGTWDSQFTSELERWRLLIEARAVSFHHLSAMQQGWVARETAEREQQCGREVLNEVLAEAGIVDMGEKFNFFGLISTAPLSLQGVLVGNEWKWDARAMAIWTLIAFCFPGRGEQVMATLRRTRAGPIDSERDVPQFMPVVYDGERDPTASQIVDHLVFDCGLHRADLRHVFKLAADWGKPEIEEDQARLRLLLNEMHARGETNTIGLRPLLYAPDDIAVGDLTAEIVIARHERRHARASTAATSHRTHDQTSSNKRSRA